MGGHRRIGTYFAVGISLIFILVAPLIVFLVNSNMKQQALAEAESKARLLLDRNLATHTYFTKDLKPRLFDELGPSKSKDYFDPIWMSSTYAVRKMDKYFRQFNTEPYYYKEAAVSARSDDNEADEYERQFLKDLAADPDLTQRVSMRVFDGRPFFTVLRRGEDMEQSCLRCHSTPDRAPGDMVRLYGSERSFHRNIGDVVQAISMRIPLAAAYGNANRFSLHLSAALLAILLGVFVLFAALGRRFFLNPLAEIRDQATRIATDPEHLGKQIADPTGKELRDLVAAFNAMSASLKQSRDLLDERVRERTAELELAKEELEREILERKQIEEALKESEALYRTLFQAAADSIYLLDLQAERPGMIVSANPAAAEMHGYTVDELLTLRIADLDTPESAANAPERIERLLNGERLREEVTHRRKDGTVFPLEINAQLLELGGRKYALAIDRDITERKRAEEALRASEERFRILAEGAFEGVVISRHGVILDCNEVFCRMSGYSLEELAGMNVRDIIAPEFRDIAMRHILSGSEDAYESALVRKDGHIVPMQAKGKTIPYEGGEAGIASVRDISAAKMAEEVQKRLATAIEQSAEAVLITDPEGVIQYVNPAIERITGFSKEDLIGKTPRVFRGGEHDQAFYRHLWDTIKAGNIWSGRLVNKRKDGSLFQEEATISPVRNTSGQITNFLAVKRDITEHLELSNQLAQAQKMEAVGTLAGGVAHDFNNLLQVVLGYSELMLADRDFPARYADDLAKIFRAAKNGADLVDRLLTFSRKTEFKPRPVNLNQRIEQLQKMLSRTIPKMIDIELALADDLAAINADPTQMEQILMNLAVNARDAMPDGGRLLIRTENVVLDEHYCKTHLGCKPGSYMLLSVSDTGEGIDKDTLQHIFEPFFTTKRPGEGTGLGLAMVHGIVEQHGGFIRCYSEPSEGTAFRIYFPALPSGEMPGKMIEQPIVRGGSETILIADDEEPIRDLGVRILTKAGYSVIMASNGKEALDVYRARGGEISVVILDLIMPEMGGSQCLEELLKINPDVKVIIASGFSVNAQTGSALESGAKGFVNKPFNISEMLRTVRKVLDEE